MASLLLADFGSAEESRVDYEVEEVFFPGEQRTVSLSVPVPQNLLMPIKDISITCRCLELLGVPDVLDGSLGNIDLQARIQASEVRGSNSGITITLHGEDGKRFVVRVKLRIESLFDLHWNKEALVGDVVKLSDLAQSRSGLIRVHSKLVDASQFSVSTDREDSLCVGLEDGQKLKIEMKSGISWVGRVIANVVLHSKSLLGESLENYHCDIMLRRGSSIRSRPILVDLDQVEGSGWSNIVICYFPCARTQLGRAYLRNAQERIPVDFKFSVDGNTMKLEYKLEGFANRLLLSQGRNILHLEQEFDMKKTSLQVYSIPVLLYIK